ncbi:MAG: hypothetical protein J1E85_07215 [Ruminococcus sp.]|nr:hypothetical protein [Ruminococcus sp.]
MSVTKNITIQKLIQILLGRIKFIILLTVIGGLLFFCYSEFIIQPIYSTSSMVSVLNYSSKTKDGQSSNEINGKIYGSDISGSNNLAKICVTLFNNTDELTALYDGCSVNISIADNSFFIIFSVSGTDPQKCANVANQLADKSKEVFVDYMAYGQMRTVREARVPTRPDSPNNVKNGMMGLVVGFALACAISILLELIDTTIRVDDDIQNMYGIPVFAEIPDFES